MKFSIITSLKRNEIIEGSLKRSLMDFAIQRKGCYEVEWLWVSADQGTLEANGLIDEDLHSVLTLKKIQGGHNRGSCMNLGVRYANGNLLWFLHADSSFSEGALDKFLQKTDSENKIYYFDLKFSRGPWAMIFNEWGVHFRCRFLKTPFGDQGLCMSKWRFDALGGYDERAPYGEDHLLIRKARRHGVGIIPVGESLVTSSRKYQEQGWLKTTLTHQYLWYKQILCWYRDEDSRYKKASKSLTKETK